MDVDAWNTLVLDAQARGIDATRPIFERVLKALPTAVRLASTIAQLTLAAQVRYWKMYIEQELKVKNFALVEQLFSRCLLSCPNVEIWRLCTQLPPSSCAHLAFRSKLRALSEGEQSAGARGGD